VSARVISFLIWPPGLALRTTVVNAFPQTSPAQPPAQPLETVMVKLVGSFTVAGLSI